MTTYSIAWDRVRRRDASALRVGDTWVVPAPFTTYHANRDGAVVGHGCEPLTGTAWTVLAHDGELVTARSHDGRQTTEPLPANARVLRVERPA